MRTLYLVTYDISDERRLSRVAKVCEGFGRRLQKSVFECPLTDVDLVQLRERLRAEVKKDVDQVLLVRIGPAGADSTKRMFEAIGRTYEASTRLLVIA